MSLRIILITTFTAVLFMTPAVAQEMRPLDVESYLAAQGESPVVRSREDIRFFFALEGPGAFGKPGTNDEGYDFEGGGPCVPAGWFGEYSDYVALRQNDFLPGPNETCLWTYFDPDTTEVGYPMGVFPYGPPYAREVLASPPLERDAQGRIMLLKRGQGQVFLSYDIYFDMPMNALVFHTAEVIARGVAGDYSFAVDIFGYIMYGVLGWIRIEEDITDEVFESIGEETITLGGIKARLILHDLCGSFCGVWGTGYPHTLGALIDNISLSIVMDDDTGVPETAPAATRLHAVNPNPFNPSTEISFSLALAGAVELSICDLSGRRVRTLQSVVLPAGNHRLEWDGRDDGGRPLASGVYLVQLETAQGRQSAKAVLLK